MERDGAPKPKNFDLLAAAWANPQQWVAEVAEYNRQLEDEEPEIEPAPLELGLQHNRHLRDLLQKQARGNVIK